MIAKKLGYLASALVIGASGIYLFVYLYRWEWNRALIAGVILIIAQLTLVASLILDRLASFEKRIERLEEGGSSETVDTIKRTAPPARSRFKWLTGDGDLNVFVPVLMGAGVLFAGIAWLVERIARVTARPALEYGLAYRLAPLALPEGSLTAPLLGAPAQPREWFKRYRAPLLLVVLLATLVLSIDALGDLTQNRPDAKAVGGSGQITLQVDRNGFFRPQIEAAQNLWAVCSGTLGRAHAATAFEQQSRGRVLLVIEPAPGQYAQRRLRGCLDDATLDNIQARVLDMTIGK